MCLATSWQTSPPIASRTEEFLILETWVSEICWKKDMLTLPTIGILYISFTQLNAMFKFLFKVLEKELTLVYGGLIRRQKSLRSLKDPSTTTSISCDNTVEQAGDKSGAVGARSIGIRRNISIGLTISARRKSWKQSVSDPFSKAGLQQGIVALVQWSKWTDTSWNRFHLSRTRFVRNILSHLFYEYWWFEYQPSTSRWFYFKGK